MKIDGIDFPEVSLRAARTHMVEAKFFCVEDLARLIRPYWPGRLHVTEFRKTRLTNMMAERIVDNAQGLGMLITLDPVNGRRYWRYKDDPSAKPVQYTPRRHSEMFGRYQIKGRYRR